MPLPWQGDRVHAIDQLHDILRDPLYASLPLYLRMPVLVTYARVSRDVAVWRQLMQTYRMLGAEGWIARLLPEWQAEEPDAAPHISPIMI